MMRPLTERLNAIAAYVPVGSRVADIGTDHGFLPIDLLLQGRSDYVVLTDIRSGPLTCAHENLVKAGLINGIGGDGDGGMDVTEKADACWALGSIDDAGTGAARRPYIDLRLGDGLVPVCPGEVDIAVIAGMGGEAIAGILAADPMKTCSIGLFALQPRTRSIMLRQWIDDQGYHIMDEDLVREGHRICEIIIMHAGSVPDSERLSGCAPLSRDTKRPARYVPSGSGINRISERVPSIPDARRPSGRALSASEDGQFERLMSKRHPLLKDFILAKIRSERAVLAEMGKGGVPLSETGEAGLTHVERLERWLAHLEDKGLVTL
jgi:tRNA A22 N-methylase